MNPRGFLTGTKDVTCWGRCSAGRVNLRDRGCYPSSPTLFGMNFVGGCFADRLGCDKLAKFDACVKSVMSRQLRGMTGQSCYGP